MSCYLPLILRWRKPQRQAGEVPELRATTPPEPSVSTLDCSGGAAVHTTRDGKGVTLSQGMGHFPHQVFLNIRHDHPTLGLEDVAYQRLHQEHTHRYSLSQEHVHRTAQYMDHGHRTSQLVEHTPRSLQPPEQTPRSLQPLEQTPRPRHESPGVVSLGLPFGISSLKLSSKVRKPKNRRPNGHMSDGDLDLGRDKRTRWILEPSLRMPSIEALSSPAQSTRSSDSVEKRSSLLRKTKIPSVYSRPLSVDAELLLQSSNLERTRSIDRTSLDVERTRSMDRTSLEVERAKFALLTSPQDFMAGQEAAERSSSGNSSGSDLTYEGSPPPEDLHPALRGRGKVEVVLATRGPPPKHLLPRKLKPSPLRKLHPLVVLTPQIRKELERYQSPEEEEDDSTEDEEIPVSLLPFTRPPTRNTRSPFGVSRHATPHGSQRRRKHTTPSPLDSGYKTMEHSYDGDSSVSSDGQIREKQTDHWEQVDRSRENTGHDRSRENPGHRTQGIMHKETEMDRISRLAPGVSHQPRRGESVYPCYLLGLPDQQLLRLLSYLPTMALVRLSVTCRRIHKLAWNSQLWQTIRLVGEQVDVDRALRSMLVKLVWGVARQGGWDRSPLGAPGVECVQLGGSARLTDRALALLARNCPQLRQLELQHCRNVTNGGVLDLLSRCNRLEHLDLTGCVMVTSLNHGRRGQELLSLGYLDLSECGSLDDTGLQMVVTSCPNLTHLYLRKCTGISDRGVKSIASYCPQLRELSLSDCKGVGDQGVQELSRLGPSLRYLSVAKCPALTDFGLRPVWKHCYKLRYLNLRGCTAMNDSTLQYIASSCTKLRSLDVGKCEVSDQGLRLLASRLPNLRKLSVRGCSRVQDGGVAALAGGCTSLTHLNIEDCDLSVNLVRSLIKTLRRCYIQHSAALG